MIQITRHFGIHAERIVNSVFMAVPSVSCDRTTDGWQFSILWLRFALFVWIER